MVINLSGLKVRSIEPGAVYPKNARWCFAVMVNGHAWESQEPYETAHAAKQDMREEVRRLRSVHCLEPMAA